MTENFQHKFYQEECKQSKGAKICASIRRELACEKKNAQKLSSKYLQDKIYRIKQMKNIPVTLKPALNQLKKFQKKSELKWTPPHVKF